MRNRGLRQGSAVARSPCASGTCAGSVPASPRHCHRTAGSPASGLESSACITSTRLTRPREPVVGNVAKSSAWPRASRLAYGVARNSSAVSAAGTIDTAPRAIAGDRGLRGLLDILERDATLASRTLDAARRRCCLTDASSRAAGEITMPSGMTCCGWAAARACGAPCAAGAPPPRPREPSPAARSPPRYPRRDGMPPRTHRPRPQPMLHRPAPRAACRRDRPRPFRR